ncbi:MAG: shikimate dehydrogenase [Beijerinckiaceae bacterium]|jgi:shikimate dehydrogenase|nr:shikimate dehydrogenase [Beijerinckiaceae bacterium]
MTDQCFVAGSPISHSRSPMIHGFWMAERGLDARYDRIETTPDQLAGLLARVRSGDLRGGNLTVPLKEAVIAHLDDLTPEAAIMGAVNTVWMKDGRLTGANTDVDGFFAHLGQELPGWTCAGRDVLVLGAGGAARAIIHGLMRRGAATVTLANRSVARATALVASLSASHPGTSTRLRLTSWPVASEQIAAHALVVNTTSLGMKGEPPLPMAWPVRLDGQVFYDIVYAPLLTPFLAEARARGAIGVDGLGMLLHQAALAFGHWFGAVPEVSKALRTLVEADLVAPAQAQRP